MKNRVKQAVFHEKSVSLSLLIILNVTKMVKTLNYVKIMVLCICSLTLLACNDDDNGLDDMLCRTWVNETIEDDLEVYTHQLIFVKKGRSGQEIKKRYTPSTGTTNTETRDFTWEWEDGSQECLVLKYGAGDIKYFENVWVRNHYLSGKVGGQIIMMTDIEYLKK